MKGNVTYLIGQYLQGINLEGFSFPARVLCQIDGEVINAIVEVKGIISEDDVPLDFDKYIYPLGVWYNICALEKKLFDVYSNVWNQLGIELRDYRIASILS